MTASGQPDDDTVAAPRTSVLTARPGVSPTVRWVAIGAAAVGMALLARLTRWLCHR